MQIQTSPTEVKVIRRLPIGAELQPGGGVHFRVWAPESNSVDVLLNSSPDWEDQSYPFPLSAESGGYFSGLVAEARDGQFYKLRLDSGEFPDPASRFQPRGPHGPSQICNSSRFPWTDEKWKGILSWEGQVIYEMHIGTFTREGTFSAAAKELPELANCGITIVEIMPVAEFSGRFGWGYDGVNLFAPMHHYGTPDDLRSMIDRAHEIGLGVILDVVYNHFGPDGNYLGKFSSDYTTERYKNEWGEAINFDGPESEQVREFFISNAVYWIQEFHFDGFRFDATQQIFDCSQEHILAAISRKVRAASNGRALFLAAENEDQQSALARDYSEDGCGLDAVWNDDFHHSCRVALTGRSEAYYSDYKGGAQELLSAVKWGYLYQGQWYGWQNKNRGTPGFGLSPAQFINYLENHDQVANSLRGQRIHQLAHPGAYRALTALLLLSPGTPLIFQGEEFGSSAPFVFFADHNPELAKLVRAGRKEFLCQFPSICEASQVLARIAPESEKTFLSCKLDFTERVSHATHYQLHRDLLQLRKTDPVFSAQTRGAVDGAVLNPHAFLLRYFGREHGDRLLLMNLGRDLELAPIPEPLLAPPHGQEWALRWSSEDPQYGGNGTPPVQMHGQWVIPGYSAIVVEQRESVIN